MQFHRGEGGKNWELGWADAIVCRMDEQGPTWSTGNCKLGAKWQQRPGSVSVLPTHGEDACRSAFHPLQVQQNRPSQAALGEKDSDQQLQRVGWSLHPSHSWAPVRCSTFQLIWHFAPGNGIRFHRLRVQSHKSALHFRCQSQAQVVTYVLTDRL